jgi:hypothetical protein
MTLTGNQAQTIRSKFDQFLLLQFNLSGKIIIRQDSIRTPASARGSSQPECREKNGYF